MDRMMTTYEGRAQQMHGKIPLLTGRALNAAASREAVDLRQLQDFLWHVSGLTPEVGHFKTEVLRVV